MEKGSRGRIIRILIAAGAVAFCVLLFVLFGRKDEPPTRPEAYVPLTADTAPPGAAFGELIGTLSEKAGFIVTGPEDRHAKVLSYTLEREDIEPWALCVGTDAVGRAASVRVEISYLKPDFDTATIGQPALETLRREYERRQDANAAALNDFLAAVLEQIPGVDTADRANIRAAAEDSFRAGKTLGKKYGALKLSAVTEMTDERTAMFTLELEIDSSKLK